MVVTSKVLPPYPADAAIASDGTIFVLRFTNRFSPTAVDSYPVETRGLALPNVPYIGGVSLAVTSAGAVWLSANGRFVFRPPGARSATELP